jgi:hypothetical protein
MLSEENSRKYAMPRKKIAEEKPVVSGEGAASAAAAPAPKPRAPRARTTAVTHKHKKSTQVAEPAPAPQTEVQTTAPAQPPSHEEIAVLAYSYWEARGYQGDSQVEDWLRAEQELRRARGIA